MPDSSTLPDLHFRPLTIDDKNGIQRITLNSGLQNCNYNFANLIGWRILFDTEVCLLPDTVIIRYNFNHRRPAFFLNSASLPDRTVIESLRQIEAKNGRTLTIINVNDEWATQLKRQYGDSVSVEPLRNSYDYIYLRDELEQMKGKNLKAKRNHINKFLSQHPDFEFRKLVPEMFDRCRQLAQQWREEVQHDNPWYGNTIESEHQMIEEVFRHWDTLDMYGGTIFVDGEMIAFSFGAAVTNDTFDTCVEKANRSIDGAFNIINQQMAQHLPMQFRYINREEDMGLEGLRKSKLSYHPYHLLSYNILTFEKI
ncbi:MAG: DUF2156 domain-containing protein [Bacteroidales bacterium]|nr:DUF2156 domain-containing protein [Bacteroidales bacterium]